MGLSQMTKPKAAVAGRRGPQVGQGAAAARRAARALGQPAAAHRQHLPDRAGHAHGHRVRPAVRRLGRGRSASSLNVHRVLRARRGGAEDVRRHPLRARRAAHGPAGHRAGRRSRRCARSRRGLIGLTNVIVRGKGLKKGPFVSEQELLGIVEAAAEDEVIEHEERELIESIIEFGDTVAREVMVPRPDMVTIAQRRHRHERARPGDRARLQPAAGARRRRRRRHRRAGVHQGPDPRRARGRRRPAGHSTSCAPVRVHPREQAGRAG